MLEEINILKFSSYKQLGNKLFLLGTFFLPSALPISAIFFVTSLIISYKNFNLIKTRDKWNYPLFISIGIILFATVNTTLIDKPISLTNYDISFIWTNLINWIPIFFYFWGFQLYLKTNEERINFSKYLIAGTIPVIFSMILQKFFMLYGPYETFFGLIVWFQKPIKYDAVTGLFSNPNYTSMWLSLVLPFVIAFVANMKPLNIKKYFLLTFLIAFIYFLLLTQSRNGVLSIFVTFLFIFNLNSLSLIALSSLTLIFVMILYYIALNYKNFFDEYLPNILFQRLFEFDFSQANRPYIWQSALSRIQERPLFGWGGSTFSYLQGQNEELVNTNINYIPANHSHNMILELAHNFGLPLAILLSATLTLFIFRAYFLIYFKKNLLDQSYINKAWFVSILVFLITHLTDITFYDGKISILICILFSGLKNIVNDYSKT